ncbi:MAG: hypothetical protein Q7T81_01815 [Pseudolabrys sp.]|nr:hypothetical protein [Pseudolabrys sp.]
MLFKSIAACALMAATLVSAPARAAGEFPYDRVLLLDVPAMKPLKRVPILKVGDDGMATIELWCRTANARVQVTDNAIRIETAPLSAALPQYMSSGQCSDDRVQADNVLLEEIVQVTEWRARGDSIELIGPKPMRFRAATH